MDSHLPSNPLTSVQRFDGRDLGSSSYSSIGQLQVGKLRRNLPLLRLLRRRYPGAQIDFWGSEATADFERALCGNEQPLDWRISWDQPHSKVEEKSRIESIANAATSDMRRLVHSIWQSTATVSTHSPKP